MGWKNHKGSSGGRMGGGVETLHLVPHHGPLLLINKVRNEHFDTLGNFLKAYNSDRKRFKAENKDDIFRITWFFFYLQQKSRLYCFTAEESTLLQAGSSLISVMHVIVWQAELQSEGHQAASQHANKELWGPPLNATNQPPPPHTHTRLVIFQCCSQIKLKVQWRVLTCWWGRNNAWMSVHVCLFMCDGLGMGGRDGGHGHLFGNVNVSSVGRVI